jgi:hypothetical protein
MSSALRHSASAFSALLASGCILLVSPETGGAHCRFAGQDGVCGDCVRAQCQGAVDAACAVDASGVLAELDACASRRDASCTTLASDASSPQANALAACVSGVCAGACAPTAGASTTHCAALPFGDGRECSCTTEQPTNDYVCSRAVFPDTLCCAPHGWPGAGLECRCLPAQCGSNATGCSCFLSPYAATMPVCTGETCCVDQDSCICGPSPCIGNAVKVTSCVVSVMQCPTGTEPVASCSMAV